MFNDLIVGVGDYEAGRDAIALALQLVSGEGRLTLAYVEVVMVKSPDRPVWQIRERQHAMDRLASLREEFRVDAQLVSVDARSVASGLHELAADAHADLLVIGASRRDDYERMFVTDEVREALENAPCAVAVAPIGYGTRPPVLRKIGAASDGSPESDHALAVARELAHAHGARLSEFEAVPAQVHVPDPQHDERELDERDLEAARGRIAKRGDVEPHAAIGDDAAEALAQYAADVDMLVLGSHRYRPTERFGFGSTAQRLAADAPCPLLVLSSAGPLP
jgi:nucleotide-binding universal stress UspA family protein